MVMTHAPTNTFDINPPAADPAMPTIRPTEPGGLRLTIAASSRLTRCGLQTMFSELDIPVQVRTVDSVEHAAREFARSAPDLLVIATDATADDELRLSELARSVRAKVVLILRDAMEGELQRAARLSADAYLLEHAVTTQTLRETLLRVADGEMVLPESVARLLLAQVRRLGSDSPSRLEPLLSPREKQTLELLVDGMSNKQIARRLNITEHGAKRHVANVLAKLNCPNRTHAVALAVREGLCAA